MQGIYLPTPAAADTPGSHLVILDYRRRVVVTAPADSSGVMLGRIPGPDAGYLWLIERMAVSTTSSGPTTAIVYAGIIDPAYVLDATQMGNADIADEASPILLDSAQDLICQWTGASSGAVGTLNVQFQLVQRQDG